MGNCINLNYCNREAHRNSLSPSSQQPNQLQQSNRQAISIEQHQLTPTLTKQPEVLNLNTNGPNLSPSITNATLVTAPAGEPIEANKSLSENESNPANLNSSTNTASVATTSIEQPNPSNENTKNSQAKTSGVAVASNDNIALQAKARSDSNKNTPRSPSYSNMTSGSSNTGSNAHSSSTANSYSNYLFNSYYVPPTGKNKRLKKDFNKYFKYEKKITEAQLKAKREEFWDTAPMFDGKVEIWSALRAAVEALENKNHQLAQAIIDSANIIVPNGHLNDCYDELGNRYQIPVYVLVKPTNLRKAAKKNGADETAFEEDESTNSNRSIRLFNNTKNKKDKKKSKKNKCSGSRTGDEDDDYEDDVAEYSNGPDVNEYEEEDENEEGEREENEDGDDDYSNETDMNNNNNKKAASNKKQPNLKKNKNKKQQLQEQQQNRSKAQLSKKPLEIVQAQGDEERAECEPYPIKLRISTRHENDIKVSVKPNQTVASLKAYISENFHIEPCNQRLFFGGKQLKDAKSIQKYRINKNFVVQVIVREQPLPQSISQNEQQLAQTNEHAITN
jgi:hypothetical protein